MERIRIPDGLSLTRLHLLLTIEGRQGTFNLEREAPRPTLEAKAG